MEKFVEEIKKYLDKKLDIFRDEITETMERNMEQQRKNTNIDFQHYIGIVFEMFQSKVDTVSEMVVQNSEDIMLLKEHIYK